jgi:hypothetical protein
MNYQSSSNYFLIKNPFINYFLWFYTALDWASNSGKIRGSGARLHRHRGLFSGRRVIYRVSGGSLVKFPGRIGILGSQPSDQARTVQIRSRLKRSGTQRAPSDERSTMQILM